MPANKDEIHLFDEGTAFIVTFKEWNETTNTDDIVDIGPSTEILFHFKKINSGTVIQKTASLLTDGSDGKAVYITLATDLDEIGKWQLQGQVDLPGGHWSSNVEDFKVYSNLW